MSKDSMQGPVPTPTVFAPGGYAKAKNPTAGVATDGGFPGTPVATGVNQMNDTRKPEPVVSVADREKL